MAGGELVRRADVEPVASPLEEEQRKLGCLQVTIHRGQALALTSPMEASVPGQIFLSVSSSR